jgi:hypothetical protein
MEGHRFQDPPAPEMAPQRPGGDGPAQELRPVVAGRSSRPPSRARGMWVTS